MRNWLLGAALLAVVGAPIAAEARRLGAYDYPFVSPLVATVAATPPANQAALPSEAEIRAVGRTRYVKVFPDRPVPEIYWFLDRGLPYLIYPQPDPRAPLFFLIGGTGAGHDSSKSLVMTRVLYQAGFQVVSLPSPTHPSFIVAASRASVPGMLEEDAADLYHVMDLVDRQLQVELAPSAYYVGGYSLGGAEAAFVHRLDARERRFRFAKALLVNPPVSLYSSLTILDDMLDRYLREDPAAVNGLLDRLFAQMGQLHAVREQVDFGDPSFIYRAYTVIEPPERELELLIGLAFRMAANDMSFAADVMTRAGYMVPKDAHLTVATSLTDVLLLGLNLDFARYFEQVFLPHVLAMRPQATRAELIEAASLRSIEPYLRTAPGVVLVGTADDPILRPGEVDWLDQVFGERARIFPTGGHCGSIDQREFVAAMRELLGR
ncbi:MAG: alpha/beta fold hydrolase [Geminicoccaceae bacterium]